jgi:hypothetical protein
MFGPEKRAADPSCSAIAVGFNRFDPLRKGGNKTGAWSRRHDACFLSEPSR